MYFVKYRIVTILRLTRIGSIVNSNIVMYKELVRTVGPSALVTFDTFTITRPAKTNQVWKRICAFM